MKIIGLTGSIATGKSFVADYLRQKKIKVFCADFEVANLLQTPEVIAIIKNSKELAEAAKENTIDKKLLSEKVFSNQSALQDLENILHPLVEQKAKEFIHSNESDEIIVLEVPLLFEKNYQKYCNKVITTYCNENLQKERVLARKNIDNDRFNFIIKQQMPIHLKALLTDYIVYTGVSDEYTKKQIEEILR